MKRSALVIIRPPADQSRLEPLRTAIAELRHEGHRVHARVTFEDGDARRWARSAALRGIDVVIAAGGDGTINQVVNGLAASRRDVPLGVVPLGTANDFAKGLGLPMNPAEALRTAVLGEPTALDVARVNRRCFVNVSTGGLAAESTRRAGRGIKRFAGGLAYVFSGMRLFWDYQPPSAVFTADGNVLHDGVFAFFAVANARLTGGGTPVAPHARPQDGLLDITIVGDVGRTRLLRLLPLIRAGKHIGEDGVIYARAHRLDVEPAGVIAVNADGERVAGSVFRYDVLPRRLPIVAPSSGAERSTAVHPPLERNVPAASG